MHLYEPRHKKTCLRDLQPGKTQTGLCSHRKSLEIAYIATKGIILSKELTTKVLIRLRRLICAFVVHIGQKQVFS